MGEEAQRLKREKATSYDYENDPRWTDYWANVLIPPHMATRHDVLHHFKLKFYQRYIDPNLVVEPMSTTSTASSHPPRSSPSSPPSVSAPTRSSGSSRNRSTGTSAPPLRLDWHTILFSVNAWVFVVAVLAVVPLVPRNLSNRAYRLSFLGTTCSSLYSLCAKYGKPIAWNLQALQNYLRTIAVAKDFILFMYCLSFVTSHLCLKFALIPIICRSSERVARFLRHNFSRSTLYRKYLELPCVWVESNNTTLNILTSYAEIGLGLMLFISLFSWQRNIIQTLMYWQLLKLMYHAPVTASYHRSVWACIGRIVNPFIHRHAPFLNSPITAVQGWWFR